MADQSFFLLIGHFVSFLSYVNPLHGSHQVISYILMLDEAFGSSRMAISRKGKREGERT